MELDHIVIAAARLQEGRAWVEQRLGAELAPGGRHAAMGTHNCLLSLGSETYLEVIAVDPQAEPPAFARCFGLDAFSGPPRLVAWMARVGDLTQALQTAPPGSGRVRALSRGDLRWRMAVPEGGIAPFGGTYPGLIEWQGRSRPPERLPDRGIRLDRLGLVHPDADGLNAALDGLDYGRIEVRKGPRPEISARLRLAAGTVALL